MFSSVQPLSWNYSTPHKAKILSRNSAVANPPQPLTQGERTAQLSHPEVFKRNVAVLQRCLLQDLVPRAGTQPVPTSAVLESPTHLPGAVTSLTAIPQQTQSWDAPSPPASHGAAAFTVTFWHSFPNSDSRYDNDENYLGIDNSSSLGLFRFYIWTLWYSLWGFLRWITAGISQEPTASKSGWGQEETATAKGNLRNSNKIFTLGNVDFFFFEAGAIHHRRKDDTSEKKCDLGCINEKRGHVGNMWEMVIVVSAGVTGMRFWYGFYARCVLPGHSCWLLTAKEGEKK